MLAPLTNPLTIQDLSLPLRDETPELTLFHTLLETAAHRVETVLEFARNWTDWRQRTDYEFLRAQCQFHLEWLFDDAPGAHFTFRELCELCEHEGLQDVERARSHIRQAFDLAAAQEVMRPVSPKLRRHVICTWLDASLDVNQNIDSRDDRPSDHDDDPLFTKSCPLDADPVAQSDSVTPVPAA